MVFFGRIIFLMKFIYIAEKAVLIILCAVFLVGSVRKPMTTDEQIENYARPVQFDYFSWTVNALLSKLGQSGLAVPLHVSADSQARVVERYFELVHQLNLVQQRIQVVYSDASISDPETAAREDLVSQKMLQSELNALSPVVESILQSQVDDVLDEMGLTSGGQPIPPVLYRTTPLPKALIISPRGKIEQQANISLLADLPLDKMTALEKAIEKNLDISALVVDIGGVGVYPTMVMQSSDMGWVVDTIAHEWTHNYLTLHPLGVNYDKDNSLRTMNETAASIAGGEISSALLKEFYPDLGFSLQESQPGTKLASTNAADSFDFRAEMHLTRVTVDGLLQAGKVTEAESYMESQRQVFVKHGYLLRRLNQAYFAFYGAYADVPGGAAGEDPVGPAVRLLREQSGSLAAFIKRIAEMTSFEELQAAVK